jgi:hypothetical protein
MEKFWTLIVIHLSSRKQAAQELITMVARFRGKAIFATMCFTFLIMAIAMAKLSVDQHFDTKKILDLGVQANCRITRITKLTRKKGFRHDVELPTCEFVDKTRQARQLTAQSYYLPSHYKIGDIVSIYYDPQNPANARWNSYAELWSGRDSGILVVAITLCLSGLMALFI